MGYVAESPIPIHMSKINLYAILINGGKAIAGSPSGVGESKRHL
jgi:hypothetical protein